MRQRLTCGQIDQILYDQTHTAESCDARRDRWLDLTNHGLLLLESPDPRQHVDCTHLGLIRDRLDCACPRRWVRACKRHGFCTIDPMAAGDERSAALDTALRRLGAEQIIVCAHCVDYTPDD
ncbi:MAG: hypothetical protein IRY99_26180 [Isosphaeraceae bacterium]|nr:hypothetical protein [Isosphaeraceae bacterium]